MTMLNQAYLFVRGNLSISVFSHFSEDSENFGQFSRIEPATFRSAAERSTNWAFPQDPRHFMLHGV